MAGPAADPGAAMEPVQGSSAPAEADQTDAGQVAVDLEDRLRRALADLENTRKRCERQVADSQEAEWIRITQAWLPIGDNLDRALGYADAEPSAVIEGVRAVREQAVALLASLGFRRHDETDVPFDPQ